MLSNIKLILKEIFFISNFISIFFCSIDVVIVQDNLIILSQGIKTRKWNCKCDFFGNFPRLWCGGKRNPFFDEIASSRVAREWRDELLSLRLHERPSFLLLLKKRSLIQFDSNLNEEGAFSLLIAPTNEGWVGSASNAKGSRGKRLPQLPMWTLWQELLYTR